MTVAEMIDYLCDVLLIEHQDGTLPDELYLELQACTKRMKKNGAFKEKLTDEQMDMPWDQFLAEVENAATRQ